LKGGLDWEEDLLKKQTMEKKSEGAGLNLYRLYFNGRGKKQEKKRKKLCNTRVRKACGGEKGGGNSGAFGGATKRCDGVLKRGCGADDPRNQKKGGTRKDKRSKRRGKTKPAENSWGTRRNPLKGGGKTLFEGIGRHAGKHA